MITPHRNLLLLATAALVLGVAVASQTTRAWSEEERMNKSFLMFVVFVCLLAFDLLIAAHIHGCRMQMRAMPGQGASLENEVQWMTRILTVTNLPGALCFHVEDYLKEKLEMDLLRTSMWRETLRPIYYLLIVGFESWLYVMGIRWVIGKRRSKP